MTEIVSEREGVTFETLRSAPPSPTFDPAAFPYRCRRGHVSRKGGTCCVLVSIWREDGKFVAPYGRCRCRLVPQTGNARLITALFGG